MQSSESGRELVHTTPVTPQLTGLQGVELEVDHDGNRRLKIEAKLAEQVNLCVPITTTLQTDRNWTPSPQLVSIPEDEFYSPGKFKKGDKWVAGFTPSSRALATLAHTFGITLARTRYNRFPGGVECIVKAEWRAGDGVPRWEERSRVVRFAEHEERLKLQSVEKAEREIAEGKDRPMPSEKTLRKQYLDDMEFIDAKLQTKAFSRCVRALLGIGPMTRQEAQKPFLGIAWLLTPDYSDPDTRHLLSLQYAQSVADLYGADDGAHAITTEVHGETPLAALRHEEEELEAEERQELLDAGAEQPPEDEPEPETIDAFPDEDMGPGDAPEKPDDAAFTLRRDSKSGFPGWTAEQLAQDPEGRKYLMQMARTMKDDAKRQQVLRWLSWIAEKPITVENLDEILDLDF
jgi:hypothetical protein